MLKTHTLTFTKNRCCNAPSSALHSDISGERKTSQNTGYVL